MAFDSGASRSQRLGIGAVDGGGMRGGFPEFRGLGPPGCLGWCRSWVRSANFCWSLVFLSAIVLRRDETMDFRQGMGVCRAEKQGPCVPGLIAGSVPKEKPLAKSAC